MANSLTDSGVSRIAACPTARNGDDAGETSAATSSPTPMAAATARAVATIAPSADAPLPEVGPGSGAAPGAGSVLSAIAWGSFRPVRARGTRDGGAGNLRPGGGRGSSGPPAPIRW